MKKIPTITKRHPSRGEFSTTRLSSTKVAIIRRSITKSLETVGNSEGNVSKDDSTTRKKK